MSKKIYFAHAVNSYNTSVEKATEQLIIDVLLDGDHAKLENPNHPRHQRGYAKYAQRENASDKNHKGMNYFYDKVLPGCVGCVAMPYLDGRLGLGVASEALWFLERGFPAWYISPVFTIIEPEHLEDFTNNPKNGELFLVRPFTRAERELLRVDKDVGSELVLNHEETRLRTWFVYGKEQRPYEEAHTASLPVPDDFYPSKNA